MLVWLCGAETTEGRMGKIEKTEIAARRPAREPSHPGAILREDVLPAIGESVANAAKKLGVTRERLRRIITEKTPISPEMTIRLGKFCGNGPELWLRMQQAYDLWHAQRALRVEIAKIPTAKARAA
jgi:addiction module HigA family antidote